VSAPWRGDVATPGTAGLVLLRTFLCAVLALESTTYGVISPLLPSIAHSLALPESRVGLVTGAYTAGMVPACLTLVVVRRRISDITLVAIGITSLAVGCIVLANDPNFGGILSGRLLMGFGCGQCFAGAIRWLVKSAPGREGLFFGLGWGMVSVGSAVGPTVGAVALAVGSRSVHNGLAGVFVVCLAALTLIALSGRSRLTAHGHLQGVSPVALRLLCERAFLAALAPLIVPAMAIGMLVTLVPLRMADGGYQQWVAVAFTASAVIGAGCGPFVGHFVHSVGERPITLVGLAATAILLAVLSLRLGPVALAIGTIAVLGPANQAIVVSAGEKLRRTGERFGTVNASSTFLPLMFAVFETAGAVLSTKTATASPPLPFTASAVVAASCWLLTWRGRRDANELRPTESGSLESQIVE
jgi:MFS family permease